MLRAAPPTGRKVATASAMRESGPLVRAAVLFPGQGSQYPGMADAWLQHPASAEVLQQASEVLGWDVAERSRDAEALGRTDVVQPAVFACDVAAFAVLQAEGASFVAAAGHSLGEYAALVAGRVLTLAGALEAILVRATQMQAASEASPGAMTALVGLTPDQAREVADVAGRGDILCVANENGAKQVVLSGSVAAVARAEELARHRGARAMRLSVAGAFHSPLMEPAVQPVRDVISRVPFEPPVL